MPVILKRRPDAGQRFPFVPLGRAIERARELYKVANAHEVPFTTAASTWGYAEKSSGGAQTAAALKSFGLVDDVSGSDVRKIKLTDSALRIIRDPREISPDRDGLIREAALKPLLHREIIDKYSGMPPSDEALKAFLLIDRGLKDEAVPEFIREFAATMSFAKVAESATIQDKAPDVLIAATSATGTSKPNFPWEGQSKEPVPDIKIGDYVQWTCNGADQFKPPRKVTKIAGDFVWVHGSNTGVPLEQITIVDAPAPRTVMEAGKSIFAEPGPKDAGPPDDAVQIDVLLTGKRLQITADVDAAGLAKLKDILAKYEEILKML
jgi:hypothetical protein